MPRFRFRPPPIAPTPELRWTLARAFGPRAGTATSGPPDPAAAIELAGRLALLPRIVARATLEELAAEVGSGLADQLRRERALTAAHELRLDATLATVVEMAAGLGVELVLLKGFALARAGYTAPGARPSSDLDLLVPAEQVEILRRELRRRGFLEAVGAGYEHHPPALQEPGGINVELHRHLPGVRLEGRRSAEWAHLARAGLLAPLAGDSHSTVLQVPAREVLIAHALVHALAQHGLSTGYPGWLLIGDLLDLAATAEDAASIRSWIEGDLSSTEATAALDLARRLGAGADPFGGEATSPSRRLAEHLTAAALDVDYRQALKARWLEAPLSDRSSLVARLRLLARTLAPPRRFPAPGAPHGVLRRTADWVGRPFVLAGRALRAAAARRRVAAARRAIAGANEKR